MNNKPEFPFNRFELDDIRRMDIVESTPKAIVAFKVGKDRQSREESFLGVFKSLPEAIKGVPNGTPINLYMASTGVFHD